MRKGTINTYKDTSHFCRFNENLYPCDYHIRTQREAQNELTLHLLQGRAASGLHQNIFIFVTSNFRWLHCHRLKQLTWTTRFCKSVLTPLENLHGRGCTTRWIFSIRCECPWTHHRRRKTGLQSGINTKTMMNQRKGERRRNFTDCVL